ncbi:Gfo/Idh/MocA family protein [Alicyclobacillus fastidiosus]|uniref:Gfo/Idh/MocA family oxidoreductase n=1 Tax=Alicyclobacillus fastidiosus TaxID=392011 RepID=A0ABV5ACD6_9BACL|nr:Gfo/Idh/MocA family oxidoreductase [Alicyclobacillus fastidiosus]WEH10526.1 Gfo/Idh/MocA family oxidoreductase [Alicyclobacillus fastidiosus]
MTQHKVAVVGCGSMSNTWLDYVQQRDDATVVALVDIFEESARAMADRRGLDVPIFTDLSQALAATEANLVFDITIPDSHKQVVTTALKAGCHVFGEKPMGGSMADAREMLDVAKVSGKRYSVMQNRRYLKQIRAVRTAVEHGAIGQVGALYADFFLGPHFGGFRDAMENPLILDMAIHTFDQARLISGANPVSVYCQEFNPPGSWYQGNASAICIFEMNDGSVFCYRGSWCAEGFPTSWESDWRITGSQGTIRWDGSAIPVCEVVDVDSEPAELLRRHRQVELPVMWRGREGHWGCLDEMFDALGEQRPAETDCTDNIYSVAMVFAAIESAKTGRKVYLQDFA